jgi:hypothetical protein
MDGFEGDVMANNKSTFHETKEVVSRLREPLKISCKAFRGKEHGHMIEISANTSVFEVDALEKDLTGMIEMWIRLIEGPMKSKYLGVMKDSAE